MSEFHGLAGTAKQKTVVNAAGLTNGWLHDLIAGDDVDIEAVTKLLNAMKAAARPS